MKYNKTINSWAGQILLLVSIGVLSGFALAQEEADLNQAFLPGDRGLTIGMPEQELLGALAAQGFAFNDEGKYERIKGSKQFDLVLDYVLVVSEAAGAKEIWGSGDVLLGVKDGILVAMGENAVHGRFVGLKAFDQTNTALEASLGTSTGIFPNYNPKRRKERNLVDQFNGLVWYLEERPSSQTEPDSYVWSHGDVITILTVRYSVELDRRTDEYHRETSLWHLHFCSFPIMSKIYKTNNFNCKK